MAYLSTEWLSMKDLVVVAAAAAAAALSDHVLFTWWMTLIYCYSRMLTFWRMKSAWRCTKWPAELVNHFSDRRDQVLLLSWILFEPVIIPRPVKADITY